MIELLNWAFEKGGAWAVIAVALAAAVVYLHRNGQREARERKREQRQQLKFLIRMAQKLRNGNGHRPDMPSRPYDPGDEPSVESDEWDRWDEPTTVTQRKQETAREEIERLVGDYLSNGHGPDSNGD